MDILTEDAILDELGEKLRRGEYHTFIGDILLILNPNEEYDIYSLHVSLMPDYRSSDREFSQI